MNVGESHLQLNHSSSAVHENVVTVFFYSWSFSGFLGQGGGFDRLLLDSLYEDDAARRQIQLQNAGYGYGATAMNNPFEQPDPFAMSNSIAPPTNVQMEMMAQQQQQYHQQQMMMQQHYQQNQSMTMVPYQYQPQYPLKQMPQMGQMGPANPFADEFSSFPQGSAPHQGNHMLI